MKVRWKVIAGIVISFGFLAYALNSVDYVEMAKAFSEANYYWTIPMIISVIITMLIRAGRWQILIKPIRELPFKSLYVSLMIGFMANNLLPARIGEVVRAISLSQRHALSKSSVFATVIAERLFDSIGILIVFFITLIVVDFPGELRRGSIIILLGTVLLLLFLFYLRIKTETAVKIIITPIHWFSKRLAGKMQIIMIKFAEGLTILTSPVSLIIIILYSVVLWAFSAISGYLIFLSFDLHPSAWAAFVVLFVTVLGVSLPSAPGYIGTYHAACVIAFGLIGKLGMFDSPVSNSVALSYSVILWSCQFVPVTLIGLYYLRKEHLRFRDMGKEEVINSTGL